MCSLGRIDFSVLISVVFLIAVISVEHVSCSYQTTKLYNANKTDADRIKYDECMEASHHPEYYEHPDISLTAPDIIKRHGFPVEMHTVTSEDGYVLELHRIPHCDDSPPGVRPKKPVLIMHGIMASSVNWVLPPAEKALAYRVAKMGYDVWLGNVRGTTYSLKHNHDSFNNPFHTQTAYWDFSWHEMGLYDVPVQIDYILSYTNQTKLTYIGHSMGCTMFFVCMSLRPEYNEKVDAMFALAPVAYVSNASTFFKILAPFSYNLERLYQYVGNGVLIPELLREILNPLMAKSCSMASWINCYMCSNLYFNMFNSDGLQMNYTMLPVYTQHFPDRVSTKTVIHYGQNLVTGKFQHFDNRIAIPEFIRPSIFPKGPPPPEYNLTKVTVPIVAFYSDRDNLADPRDVIKTLTALPNVRAAVRVCYPFFNHNDFLFGVHINELVYDKLIKMLMGDFDVDFECKNTYVDEPISQTGTS